MKYRVYDRWANKKMRYPHEIVDNKEIRLFMQQDGSVMGMRMSDHKWHGKIYDKALADEHVELCIGKIGIHDVYINDVVELSDGRLGVIAWDDFTYSVRVRIETKGIVERAEMKKYKFRIIGNVHDEKLADRLDTQKEQVWRM